MASGEGTITFKQRFALGTAHLMNGLCFQGMWFSYILVFFTKVIELPRPKAGLILLLAQFGGAVVTILVGVASDGCICAYGRRKIFHLLGMISMLLTFVFLWIDCLGCENAPDGYKVLYYSSFAVVAQFGWSGMQLAQVTLIPELATDKATRMQLNQIRYGLTTITGLVVFAVFWILLATLEKMSDVSNITPSDKTVFWVMALIMALLGFVITMPFQIWIHEKSSVGRRTVKILEWFRNPMFYLVICGFTTGRLITVITQQYIPFYLLDSLNMPKTSIAIGPMVWYLFSAVAAFLVHKFTKRLGDEMTYFLCLMLMFGSIIWIWCQPSLHKTSTSFWNHYSAYIPIAMSGATGSCLAVISLTYMSTLTGSDTGSAGFVWGAAFFCDRTSNGLVNIMIQNIPAELSSSPNFQRYVIVYANFGAGAIGLATIILIVVAKWREKKQEEYQLKAEYVAYTPEAPNINNNLDLDTTAPDPEPHSSITFSSTNSLRSEQLKEISKRTVELFISM